MIGGEESGLGFVSSSPPVPLKSSFSPKASFQRHRERGAICSGGHALHQLLPHHVVVRISVSRLSVAPCYKGDGRIFLFTTLVADLGRIIFHANVSLESLLLFPRPPSLSNTSVDLVASLFFHFSFFVSFLCPFLSFMFHSL